MKTISIHNLDAEVECRLRDMAAENGLSLNKMIKRLLRKSLGFGEERASNRERFAAFCGSWSEDRHAEFVKATADHECVEEEEWK